MKLTKESQAFITKWCKKKNKKNFSYVWILLCKKKMKENNVICFVVALRHYVSFHASPQPIYDGGVPYPGDCFSGYYIVFIFLQSENLNFENQRCWGNHFSFSYVFLPETLRQICSNVFNKHCNMCSFIVFEPLYCYTLISITSWHAFYVLYFL